MNDYSMVFALVLFLAVIGVQHWNHMASFNGLLTLLTKIAEVEEEEEIAT